MRRFRVLGHSPTARSSWRLSNERRGSGQQSRAGVDGVEHHRREQFVIPAGATRLFLGSFDGIGANYNNSGSFAVTVTDVPAVPTMSRVALLLMGLLLLAVGAYTLRRPAPVS